MLSRRPTRVMLGLLVLEVVLFIVSGLWKDQAPMSSKRSASTRGRASV